MSIRFHDDGKSERQSITCTIDFDGTAGGYHMGEIISHGATREEAARETIREVERVRDKMDALRLELQILAGLPVGGQG